MDVSNTSHISVDRGWSWVVLVAVFLSTWLAACSYMAGLFNVQLMQEFGLDASVTSLPGALSSGLFCFAGPISSVLFDAIGARRTIMIASIFAFIGYSTSAFVTRFPVLCVTFGVLGGLGTGAAYITSAIALGFYFDKYRNLAYGVASSGAGVGIMTLGPFVSYLIYEYGWRGCCIILSAVLLNYYVVAMVLLPVKTKPHDVEIDDVIPYASCDCVTCTQEKLKNAALNSNDDEESNVTSGKDHHSYPYETQRIYCELRKSGSDPCGETVLRKGVLAGMSSDLLTASRTSLTAEFYSKARINLPEKSFDSKLINKCENFLAKGGGKGIKIPHTLKRRLRIFVNPRYDLFCINFVLVNFVVGILYLHLPAYAMSMGTSKPQISTLVSIIGVANIICRLITGVITSSERCSSLLFYNTLLLTLSFLLLCAPIYGKYYAGQIVIAATAGINNAQYVLMSPFVIEFAGLDALSFGYGFLILLAGVGFLFGPPIAGCLYDLSGSYTTTFYFCGACLFLSALVMLPVAILEKRVQKR